jgi:benzylsuccinate CoA-transferase BbsF subunit
MAEQALEGVKVLDFTWQVAGPRVTSMLGRFGATVVRVESRTRVDFTRSSPPFVEGKAWLGDRSALFANLGNANKYSITLNLNHPRGLEVCKRLVAWADVVVENFTGGRMARWGLGYEDLKKINPQIIMLSLGMYGQTGPYAQQGGYGATLVALSGICQLTGWPDGPPMQPIWVYPDFAVPRLGVLAVVAALDYRRRTGKGQYLDLAQQEGMLQYVSPALLEYHVNGREMKRMGNRLSYAAPHGVYRCKGEFRWCAIAVFSDEEWRSLCQVMGNLIWAQDPELATVSGRLKNVEKVDRLVEEWTIKQTAEEVMSLLQGAGVAAGVVQNGQDLCQDPQLRSRSYYRELEHPTLGKFVYSGLPVRMSKTPYETKRSPCFGEHTEYICREFLGMSDEEFIALMQAGIFD